MPSTKHVFTSADITAIRNAVMAKYGSEADLAREAGINQASSINQYCNGQTRSCTKGTWDKLYKMIASFYPDQPSPDEEDSQRKSATVKDVADVIEKYAPGRQVLTGIINVYGIPVERISAAISTAAFLTEEQKKYLIYEIFKN